MPQYTRYKGKKEEVRALQTDVKLMRAAESVTTRIHPHLADTGLTISQFGNQRGIEQALTRSEEEIWKNSKK